MIITRNEFIKTVGIFHWDAVGILEMVVLIERGRQWAPNRFDYNYLEMNGISNRVNHRRMDLLFSIYMNLYVVRVSQTPLFLFLLFFLLLNFLFLLLPQRSLLMYKLYLFWSFITSVWYICSESGEKIKSLRQQPANESAQPTRCRNASRRSAQ